MIFVNFKNYPQTQGEKGLKLARICQEVSQKTKIPITPLVSPLLALEILKKLGPPVFLQHADNPTPSTKTGYITLTQIKNLKITGTLLNHSEHRLSPGETKNTATAAQKLGLKTIVCLSSLGQAQKWGRHLKTDYLVYEPLEFIGSSTDSVSTRRPEIIKKIADLVSPLPLLVGAGIRTPEDIKIALSLGAAGFLISSAVVLAKNPSQKLTTLAKSLA